MFNNLVKKNGRFKGCVIPQPACNRFDHCQCVYCLLSYSFLYNINNLIVVNWVLDILKRFLCNCL